MYQLYLYVPESHKEAVKEACFAASAGAIGAYSHCSWEVRGTGQFLPGEKSNPFLGQTGRLQTEPEYRVEMVVDDQYKEAVIMALRNAHPYEEPAFGLIRIEV
jgi:structural toxin protein (hemagglutinin/hemolysin) RtxA